MRTIDFNGVTYTVTEVPAQYQPALEMLAQVDGYQTIHGAKYVSRLDLDRFFSQSVKAGQTLDNDTADIYNAHRTELYAMHAELLKVVKQMFDARKRPVATINGTEYGIGITTKNNISNLTFRTRESLQPAASPADSL